MASQANSENLNQMFQAYSICTFILVTLYGITQKIAMNWNNHPIEDTEKFGDKIIPQNIKRRERAFLNNLENIPIDLIVFWVAFLVEVFNLISGSTGNECLALIILIAIYTTARVLFTLFYYLALQPYRTIVFFLGKFSMTGAACVLISSAFRFNGQVFLQKNFSA